MITYIMSYILSFSNARLSSGARVPRGRTRKPQTSTRPRLAPSASIYWAYFLQQTNFAFEVEPIALITASLSKPGSSCNALSNLSAPTEPCGTAQPLFWSEAIRSQKTSSDQGPSSVVRIPTSTRSSQ
jgi:hypothetical protein